MPPLPTKAEWAPALKGKGRILIDSDGFRMRFKKSETGKKYFICPRREDLKCPVSITVDEDSEMIVRKIKDGNENILTPKKEKKTPVVVTSQASEGQVKTGKTGKTGRTYPGSTLLKHREN